MPSPRPPATSGPRMARGKWSGILSSEENALLTQTGPDPPLGRVRCHYRLPALLVREVCAPEGPGVQNVGPRSPVATSSPPASRAVLKAAVGTHHVPRITPLIQPAARLVVPNLRAADERLAVANRELPLQAIWLRWRLPRADQRLVARRHGYLGGLRVFTLHLD